MEEIIQNFYFTNLWWAILTPLYILVGILTKYALGTELILYFTAGYICLVVEILKKGENLWIMHN